jgi:hypothetical protein
MTATKPHPPEESDPAEEPNLLSNLGGLVKATVTRPSPELVVIAIGGELDMANGELLRRAIARAIDRQPQRILVDLLRHERARSGPSVGLSSRHSASAARHRAPGRGDPATRHRPGKPLQHPGLMRAGLARGGLLLAGHEPGRGQAHQMRELVAVVVEQHDRILAEHPRYQRHLAHQPETGQPLNGGLALLIARVSAYVGSSSSPGSRSP